MPLSTPAPREKQHIRDYRVEGFRREDGLWDIEAHMTDVKTYGFPNAHRGHIEAGEPLHDMWIRMTLDEDFVVQSVEAATEAAPYGLCPEIAPNFARMAGVKLGPGWNRAIKERLGGVEGCTHLRELMAAMATVAFQTMYPVLIRKAKENPKPGKPALLDTCHAYRSDGPVTKMNWPEHYTGS